MKNEMTKAASPMALRDEELETVAGGTGLVGDITVFGPQLAVNLANVTQIALGGAASAALVQGNVQTQTKG